ncbi:60S ribosomal subunit assembly/export protein loc1 [Exophiala viscosa]|uniref:60S ribosomal subunit assembly/export protein loc1 n=1 Tax=Exophiala viscosa TaxID=2486360 RepID=UPI00219C0E1D|nr:60S ribosomal subunit assembly/export protein loc1 [Exophiala viscosa]
MAPKPPSTTKHTSKRNPQARKSATAGPSTLKSKNAKRPPPKQVKTKPGSHTNTHSVNAKSTKKRQRTYTDKQLNLPALNMITPAGVQKPRGKKKGKIFVDDQEGMMTIMAMVNADKEGQIESKMIKARHMEEIREARRAEMEKKKEKKKDELEEVKKGLKKGKKSNSASVNEDKESTGRDAQKEKKFKKRVSFA